MKKALISILALTAMLGASAPVMAQQAEQVMPLGMGTDVSPVATPVIPPCKANCEITRLDVHVNGSIDHNQYHYACLSQFTGGSSSQQPTIIITPPLATPAMNNEEAMVDCVTATNQWASQWISNPGAKANCPTPTSDGYAYIPVPHAGCKPMNF